MGRLQNDPVTCKVKTVSLKFVEVQPRQQCKSENFIAGIMMASSPAVAHATDLSLSLNRSRSRSTTASSTGTRSNAEPKCTLPQHRLHPAACRRFDRKGYNSAISSVFARGTVFSGRLYSSKRIMQSSKNRSTGGARCQGDDDGCVADLDGPSTVQLCGAYLDDIPHLRDWVHPLHVSIST